MGPSPGIWEQFQGKTGGRRRPEDTVVMRVSDGGVVSLSLCLFVSFSLGVMVMVVVMAGRDSSRLREGGILRRGRGSHPSSNSSNSSTTVRTIRYDTIR